MATHKICDAIVFNRGPRKCARVIEGDTGGTITITTSKTKEVYDLCGPCFRKIYRAINPVGQAQDSPAVTPPIVLVTPPPKQPRYKTEVKE